eukprot:6477724-Amphidinium_carterae.2
MSMKGPKEEQKQHNALTHSAKTTQRLNAQRRAQNESKPYILQRFGHGSDVVRMWFGCGSGGSDVVRTWFGRGSDVVRMRFGCGSDVVRMRFGCGSDAVGQDHDVFGGDVCDQAKDGDIFGGIRALRPKTRE